MTKDELIREIAIQVAMKNNRVNVQQLDLMYAETMFNAVESLGHKIVPVELLQDIKSLADNPTYNQLEVGFRHTPLHPKEIEERLRLALSDISYMTDNILGERK